MKKKKEPVLTSHRLKWERWEESELTRLVIAGVSFDRCSRKLKRTESAIRTRWNVIKSCSTICGICQIEVEAEENQTVLSRRLAQVFGTFINNSLNEKDKDMGITYQTKNSEKFSLLVKPIVNKKTGEAFVSFSGYIPLDYTKITKKTVKMAKF